MSFQEWWAVNKPLIDIFDDRQIMLMERARVRSEFIWDAAQESAKEKT